MVITMALCIFAAVLFFGGVTPDLAAPAYGLGILLALMWAGKLFFAKTVSWKHSPLHLPVLAFFLYALIRYFFSPVERDTRLELIDIALCTLIYFAAASNFYRARDRAWFLWALLLLGVFEAVFGIFQFATRPHWIFGYERPEQYYARGGGTYVCPNHLAGFLEIVIGLLIARLVLFRSSALSVQQLALRKIIFTYGTLVLLAGLVTTLSRSGWIATAVGIASLLFLGRSGVRKVSVRLGAIVLGLVLIVYLCWSIAPVRDYVHLTVAGPHKDKAFSVRDDSLGGRTLMWKATLPIIRENPVFGTGGMTWQWFHLKHREPKIQFRPEFAHNDFLQFTSDYGIIGAGLLAAIIGCFFWQVRVLCTEGTSSDQRSFAVGAAMAMVAILFHSWFDFNMHIMANALLLSAVVGITAAADDGKQRFKRVELSRMAKYALGLVLLAACAAAVWFVAPTWLAVGYANKGWEAKQVLHWDEALRLYAKAAGLDPKYPEPLARMGDIYRSKGQWRDPSRVDEKQQLLRQALEAYDHALLLNPFDSDVVLRKAHAYELLQENENALKCYLQALEVDPNNAFTFLQLGRFYFKQGDEVKAAEALKRSRELDISTPDNANALEELKRLQQL